MKSARALLCYVRSPFAKTSLPSRGKTARPTRLRSRPVIAHFADVHQAVRGQLAHQQEASPVAHFLESLRAAVATDKAHLPARDGCPKGVSDRVYDTCSETRVSSGEGSGVLRLIFQRYRVEIKASMTHNSLDLRT
jgi:hypothetical protein